MVYRRKGDWEKCAGLWEMEPEPRLALTPGENSVGETLFEGVGDYQCGSRKFSSKSINSHMHVACKIFRDAQISPTYLRASRIRRARIITSTGMLEAWKFPLQLYESDKISRHESVTNKYVIILDKQCNFYGAYQYDSKNRVACKQPSSSSLSGTNNPKISTPGPSVLTNPG